MILSVKNNYFFKNPRMIFLLDGIGAFFSTIFLVLLGYFVEIFGMPQFVIYKLIPITLLFTVFSLSNFLFQPFQWEKSLRIIAFANLSYCVLSLGLVWYFFEALTVFGVGYFLLEKIVIIVLSLFELKLIKKEK